MGLHLDNLSLARISLERGELVDAQGDALKFRNGDQAVLDFEEALMSQRLPALLRGQGA